MKKLDNPTQEFWFLEWAMELYKAGYILGIKSPSKGAMIYPEVLAEYTVSKVLYKGTKRERTKIDTKYKKVLAAVEYKPDFVITWAPKAAGIFFTPIVGDELKTKTTYFYAHPVRGGFVSPVEVKAPPGYGDKNCSDASFRILQKVLWHNKKVHVNKSYNYPLSAIKNKDKSFKRYKNPEPYLWMMTFTPSRFLWTDGLTKLRSIRNWEVRTLKEFLDAQQV